MLKEVMIMGVGFGGGSRGERGGRMEGELGE